MVFEALGLFCFWPYFQLWLLLCISVLDPWGFPLWDVFVSLFLALCWLCLFFYFFLIFFFISFLLVYLVFEKLIEHSLTLVCPVISRAVKLLFSL